MRHYADRGVTTIRYYADRGKTTIRHYTILAYLLLYITLQVDT